MFEVPIQAAIGGKVIARETVQVHMRKDVLAKCYGGDISAVRRSFWKSRRKERSACVMVGNVEIPQKAFMSVLKLDEE